VVVRTSNLGEADRIITLVTPVHGLVRGVAKAARKPGSKLGGHLDLLRHVSVSVRETRTLHGFSQVSTIEGFRGLREDLDRFSRASYISEMAEKFSVENGANQPLFRLLVDVLGSVEKTSNLELVVHFFEMNSGEYESRQLSRIMRAQIHQVLDRGLRSEAFMDEVRTRLGHLANGNGTSTGNSDTAVSESK
jgi:DNA repair protein RecO (recombination protein O)